MRCVFYEVEKEEGKKLREKEEPTGTCQAGIGTSAWKPDKHTRNIFCETGNFPTCPRLLIFMDYAIGTSKLKVDTGK